jgi:phosphotransferase system enzyme I (PtsI)
MVGQLSEVRLTLDALARARQQLEDAGRPYGPVELGAMIEVPAAALVLPSFLRHFDFVSIAPTTSSSTRWHRPCRRSRRPPVRPVASGRAAVVAQTRRLREPDAQGRQRVRRDGGRSSVHELLLGMGLRSFSMHPNADRDIKERVLGTDASRWAAALDQILESEDPERAAAALATEIAAPRGGPLVATASAM